MSREISESNGSSPPDKDKPQEDKKSVPKKEEQEP